MLKKKLAFHWKILIGMALGVLFGLLTVYFQWNEFTLFYIKPWGTVFINLLKLIAVPLIIVSLIDGVSNLKDVSNLSRIGLKTISLYILTTIIAVSVGLMVVNLTRPGKVFPQEKAIEFQQKFAESVKANESSAQQMQDATPLQFIVDIVPSNIVDSMSDNANMLQVIFFSLLFGVAMVLLPKRQTKSLKKFFNSLNFVVLKMIDLIMLTAPYGVFALLAGLIVDMAGDNPADSISLFAALGLYSLTVIIGLLIIIFVVYPIIIRFFSPLRYAKFMRAIVPVQLLAFSTSSSAATLPLTMETAEEKLGISNETASFVLPLGATINMDGTSLYQAVAAMFLAQVYGMELGLSAQLTIVLTATLASIGSAAVPGAGMVMLVIVLSSVGIPTEGIALIFAVDRPLDMLRTVVNVTGDLTITTLVASGENQLDFSVANRN
ncbi:MAG: dicarboxylate/amino acid:cation symporter [Bacteroidetes bacterium HGW-Bacteroidetes-16]|jgi:Na+/H+-dicarboxylate symporter|nr:MAG: dicarboxylate/amino acid:cation symporter [Bacteroidetes bacterium HGW-Bacteroidetes-16]